ncbi:hypothetical protein CWE13_00590 [Aliidiomarina shirensis]|uniref:Uncharacterized protein n=1 Tax=Aliidiomarina shirensis TaxID=1048642 RepID=A0A432WWP4_9GAMM|nr:hypothetical protein [Aliidiomarina shirensis]RUO38183.1 hypothetical protein CWE13_00590 [Aliidiomarina shirensis]
MKDREVLAWEEARVKGFGKFVLIHGVLSWGLPMLIIIGYFNNILADGATFTSVLIHCVIWFVAGGLFGLVLWFVNERRYKKHQEQVAAKQAASTESE